MSENRYQVEIFSETTENELEKKINLFLNEGFCFIRDLKDIKYAVTYNEYSKCVIYSAMIFYEHIK